jgi:serine/threonine protein kinase
VAASDPFGLTGQVLDGQFRIDGYVGEGGFSVVYRGTHVGLSEPIAVKCLKLPPALGSALVESFVKRFRDESRIHYRLSQGHLHIARCIASGTTVAPATSALLPYTALEWLDGRSLAEELDERRARGLSGRSLPEAVRFLDSAIDALAYAHAQGVVHRDLNPGNLFLTKTPSGTKLKVLDFGVAKIMSDAAIAMGPQARTLGNVRIFTPAYGAPEQFDDRVGTVGPWTDVYAVALVVLEVLTDRTIVEGEHLGELAAKALDPQRRPTPRALGLVVGDEVEAALARAVAIDPRERPCDAGELWGLLKHAMAEDEAAQRTGQAAPRRDLAPGVDELDLPPLEAPAALLQGPSSASQGLGGTLRMADAPRGSPSPPPPPYPGPSPYPSPAPPVPPADSSWTRTTGPSRQRPLPAKPSRSPLLVVVLLVLVLGALAAAWLLAPRAHATRAARAVSSLG